MSEIRGRIAAYLGNGGFFNPEHMEHEKVRDLIIDCRNCIAKLEAEVARLKDGRTEIAEALCCPFPDLTTADEIIQRVKNIMAEPEADAAGLTHR